jgi:hypothetical protein
VGNGKECLQGVKAAAGVGALKPTATGHSGADGTARRWRPGSRGRAQVGVKRR